jgi:hypothetical protein
VIGGSGQNKVSKLAFEALNVSDYDQFYASLFKLLKLSSDIMSTMPATNTNYSNKDFGAIVYNFSTCWSLLSPYVESSSSGTLPVSSVFLNRVLNEVFVIYSSGNENLQENQVQTIEKNYEFMQVLRTAFKFLNTAETVKNFKAKLSFNTIFDNSNLNVACDFFTTYWSKKLEKPLAIITHTLTYKEPIDSDDNNYSNLQILISNLTSLNYHINLIERLFISFKQTTTHSFIALNIKLIQMYKYFYKRYVLLNDYFKDHKNCHTKKSIETIMLMLNASSLLTTAPKPSQIDTNQVISRVLYNSAQIDTPTLTQDATFGGGSCLLNERILFQDVKTYINEFNSTQAKKTTLSFEIDDENDSNTHNVHLYLNSLYRWFNLESSFQLVLSDLTQCLTSTIDHEEVTSTEQDQFLFKQCEFLFLDINADQNCLQFLSKNVQNFFKSAKFVKNAADKFDNYLLNRISSFTYEIVYQMVTDYFFDDVDEPDNDAEKFDGLFGECLTYVEQSLDTPYGVQGFCDFFAEELTSASSDRTCKNHKLGGVFKPPNRFILFLATSSSPACSKKYLIKMFAVLNKLFKIHFSLAKLNNRIV